MMNEDPLMDDEQAGDAVAKYLEDNPELMQGIVPEHDLWPAIESRISARVIPLSAPAPRKARRSMGWIPTLIAASALIAGSAGITYILTTRTNTPAASGTVANGSANTGTSTPTLTPPPVGQGAIRIVQPAPDESTTARSDVSGRDNAPTTHVKRAAAQLASRNSEITTDEMRDTYDSEIASLHTALDKRRGQLNPATVEIIEQNLAVIDQAIRQSREALTRDPNSRLLNDQLDRTLAKKTGLLRAAVLLPAA